MIRNLCVQAFASQSAVHCGKPSRFCWNFLMIIIQILCSLNVLSFFLLCRLVLDLVFSFYNYFHAYTQFTLYIYTQLKLYTFLWLSTTIISNMEFLRMKENKEKRNTNGAIKLRESEFLCFSSFFIFFHT